LAALLLAIALAVTAGQPPILDRQDPNEPKKLPDGRLQSEAILKEDYKQNLKDLDEMRTLIGAVEDDLKKNDRHVLSLKALKNLEEIEKLSRRVRGRMKRY
jgi:hypothetical protein